MADQRTRGQSSVPPNAAPLRAVLLDVDDTLVDTRGAFRHALTQIASEYLREGVDPEQVTRFWQADRNGWYRAHTRGEASLREQRRRRAAELHAEFGGPGLDDEAYQIWDAMYERAFQEGWRAMDGAVELLDALDEQGIPYGAVSNAAFSYQELKLNTCGLGRVRMLVGVDTLGVGKPDPRVFLEGSRLLGCQPAEVAYVGDEYDIDALAATRAGLTGIWFDRPGNRRTDVPPDAAENPTITRVETLAEAALVVLARWSGSGDTGFGERA